MLSVMMKLFDMFSSVCEGAFLEILRNCRINKFICTFSVQLFGRLPLKIPIE